MEQLLKPLKVFSGDLSGKQYTRYYLIIGARNKIRSHQLQNTLMMLEVQSAHTLTPHVVVIKTCHPLPASLDGWGVIKRSVCLRRSNALIAALTAAAAGGTTAGTTGLNQAV